MPGNNIRGAAEQILRRPLEPIEQLILENSWEGRTYSEIAKVSGYASVYVREVGSRLWQALSDALGARVTKKNLQLLLSAEQVAQVNSPEFPSGPLSANSPLYVERQPLEQQATKALRQSGCLLRISAPRKMGRTSFLYRLMAEAKKFSYRAVVLNLQQVEPDAFVSIESFLRWLCSAVSYQLGESSDIEQHWQAGIGSKLNCTIYLQKHILEPSKNPVVLALQELDILFQYPELMEEFFSLLRGWHEEAQRLDSWQKLRIILSYATDCYLPMKLSHSPLNVGLSLKLKGFTAEQVTQLALRYGLSEFNHNQRDKLTRLVGGHPYLIAIALYHLATRSMSFEDILKSALQTNGIYGNYLRSHWSLIQTNAELAHPLYRVVSQANGVSLDVLASYQLEAAGFIRLDDGLAYPTCVLYEKFFETQLRDVRFPEVTEEIHTRPLASIDMSQRELSRAQPETVASEIVTKLERRIEHLEQQMRELQRLNQLDRITQVMNRDTFETRLQEVWQVAAGNGQAISLLLCGIDFFSVYLEAYGQIQGEACLQQVARTIQSCIDRTTEDVGLYGSEQFLVLLPYGTAEQALTIANHILKQVEGLGIRHPSNYMGWPAQVVTVSIGVASTTATPGQTASQLLEMAENGYKQAERQGHNCIKLLNF